MPGVPLPSPQASEAVAESTEYGFPDSAGEEEVVEVSGTIAPGDAAHGAELRPQAATSSSQRGKLQAKRSTVWGEVRPGSASRNRDTNLLQVNKQLSRALTQPPSLALTIRRSSHLRLLHSPFDRRQPYPSRRVRVQNLIHVFISFARIHTAHAGGLQTFPRSLSMMTWHESTSSPTTC